MSAFVVRPATSDDAEAMARVHVDSSRAAYAGILPADHLAQLDYGDRARRWIAAMQAGGRAFVALDGARVIGLADGGPIRGSWPFAGELYSIYVDAAEQRRGVGRALVTTVARMLRDGGLGSMMLWVLRANPARAFYERLGGVVAAEQPRTIAGVQLDEIAYGWRDLSRFG